ncbi:hypothetical protein Ddye_003840 [Dipteronia dyeriana]|uniref:Mediator of RNA polymerase II transcription subunit 32 n=1 Tax=Dipteronia dyeriana TaxID=168575 RepID=A0AAD9XT08_9ROSI|nr:hypothetical protein Ddye_003840 [Dipteronia dyeriana]
MDIVDALNNAYKEFVATAANVLEAKEFSGGQKTAVTDAALENFKQRWALFCDQAEEFVESVKQQIRSECLVDEATGSVVAKSVEILLNRYMFLSGTSQHFVLGSV